MRIAPPPHGPWPLPSPNLPSSPLPSPHLRGAIGPGTGPWEGHVPWCYPQMLRRGWERRVAGCWHVMHRVAGAAGTSLRPTLDPQRPWSVCHAAWTWGTWKWTWTWTWTWMDMGDMDMDMDMDMGVSMGAEHGGRAWGQSPRGSAHGVDHGAEHGRLPQQPSAPSRPISPRLRSRRTAASRCFVTVSSRSSCASRAHGSRTRLRCA